MQQYEDTNNYQDYNDSFILQNVTRPLHRPGSNAVSPTTAHYQREKMGKTTQERIAIWSVYAVAIFNVLGFVVNVVNSSTLPSGQSRQVVMTSLLMGTQAFISAVATHHFWREYKLVEKCALLPPSRILEETKTNVVINKNTQRVLLDSRKGTFYVIAARIVSTSYVIAMIGAILVESISSWDKKKKTVFVTQVVLFEFIPGSPSGLKAIMSALDQFLFAFLLFLPSLNMQKHVQYSNWLTTQIVNYRREINVLIDQKEQIKPSQIRGLQTTYARTWDNVQIVDSRLSHIVFWWFIKLVVTIVFGVRLVQYGEMFLATHLAYATFMFFIVSFAAADIVVVAKEIDYDMCRLVCCISSYDETLCNQISLLQEENESCKLALTGWNCFDIDRGFVLTVTGAVITYVVVLQQLT